jgi:hypothetical protein
MLFLESTNVYHMLVHSFSSFFVLLLLCTGTVLVTVYCSRPAIPRLEVACAHVSGITSVFCLQPLSRGNLQYAFHATHASSLLQGLNGFPSFLDPALHHRTFQGYLHLVDSRAHMIKSNPSSSPFAFPPQPLELAFDTGTPVGIHLYPCQCF